MSTGSDAHWSGSSTSERWLGELLPAPEALGVRTSRYLPMRDGVRLAIDVWLPRRPPAGVTRFPTVLRQTRYFRSLAPRTGTAALLRNFDLYSRTRRRFLQAGYAWVDVDARGSGASTGRRPHPWCRDEVLDGGAVVDWIVRQPWSTGRVGAFGISYDGTAAEWLGTLGHPAVRAIVPAFALFDAYTDVAFPGGVHLSWFTAAWAAANAALDRNRHGDAAAEVLWLIVRAAHAAGQPASQLAAGQPLLERLLAALGHLDAGRFRDACARFVSSLSRGVRPVDGPEGAAGLAAALADHAGNFNVHEGARSVTYRDDAGISPGAADATIDTFSPHTRVADLAASSAAVYSLSGWRDGGYSASAIARHAALTAGKGATPHRLTIGPWVHSGRLAIRAFALAVPTRFDHDAEVLAFFDEHVADRPERAGSDGRAVHYFTIVEGAWKSASSFPPPGTTDLRLFLDGERRLAPVAAASGVDRHTLEPTVGTGERSRWRSLLSLVPGDYPDRRVRDQELLCYDAPPQGGPLEVTGAPRVVLFARAFPDGGATAGRASVDLQLHAYLEDVAPDGTVAYVTEGQLRALHRRTDGAGRRSFRRADGAPLGAGELAELSFTLQPVSWLFRPGHRVRLALAGADADHFVPPSERLLLQVERAPDRPSRIELPVAPRSL